MDRDQMELELNDIALTKDAESLLAFSSLVASYELMDIVKDLKVSQVAELMDRVETAILRTVEDFVADYREPTQGLGEHEGETTEWLGRNE